MWALAAWAICLLAGTAGHMAGGRVASGSDAPLATTAVLAPAADHAVIPARVADDVRTADQAGPVRGLVAAGIVAAAAGGTAAVHRRTPTERARVRHLRARRHAISLRAPPLLLA